MKTTVHAPRPTLASSNHQQQGSRQPAPQRTPLSFYFLMGVLGLALVFFLLLPLFL